MKFDFIVILILVVMVIAGFCIGYLIGKHFKRPGNIGNLIVVEDPEEGPYIFMETTGMDMEKLSKQNTVELTVVKRGSSRKKQPLL